MAPAETNVGSLRRTLMTHDPNLNNRMLRDSLDELEGRQDQALLRMQNYQQLASKYYNKKVHNRFFQNLPER